MRKVHLAILVPLVAGPLAVANWCSAEVKASSVVYSIGDKAEAEDQDFVNCSKITNNPQASKDVALDAGDGGYVPFTFLAASNGTYRLRVGYYTQSVGAKIGLSVNGSSVFDHLVEHTNTWCVDGGYAIDFETDIELVAGENSIVVSSDNVGLSKYLNFDYLQVYEPFQADGTRIQAEDGHHYQGGDGYLRQYKVSYSGDGMIAALDDNVSAIPSYRIYVPEEGTYVFQFAYYCGNTDAPKYKFDFRQSALNEYEFVLPSCFGGWPNEGAGYRPYTSKANFEVDLEEGWLDLSYHFIGSGFADFDWFRLFKVNPTLGGLILAEDVVDGDANVMKSPEDYPVLSGRGVELAMGKCSWDISVPTSSKYRLYVGGYTATPGASLKLTVNGASKPNLVVSNIYATGWPGEVDEKNVIPFEVELNSGDNHIEIFKGDDFIDLDYFVLMKNEVKVSSLSLNFTDRKEVAIDGSILDFSVPYTIECENPNVAKVEADKVIAVEAGSTNLLVKYEINGANVVDRIPLTVGKDAYDHPELLLAFDTVKPYNGEFQCVDVQMPEGWSFIQTSSTKTAGIFMVSVIFTHPNYQAIIRDNIRLEITKADYAGSDLIAGDSTVAYDGEEHGVVPSAPVGWSVSCSENSFKEIGDYEVTVTFTHESYNTVTKTATLHIVDPQKAQDNKGLVVLAVLGGIVVAAGIAVAAVILVKKYRLNHETIN